MYKIMIADDEGIVIESLTHIIKQNYGDSCVIKSAKTGRSVIELAEEFRPNIAFMDIQMPGINGIEAMREIRKINQSVLFIVMSAYDKFTYAKESISLGVLDYLTKPTNKNKIIDTLEKAMGIIDKNREKRNQDLKNKEKLMTVVPMIESGMIYTILFQENYLQEVNNFKKLLGIEENHGFIILIKYGDINENGEIENSVGVSVKAHSFYTTLREIIKEFFNGVVGPVMANQIITFVPCHLEANLYDERIKIIERVRNLRKKLSKQIDLDFKIGVGSVKTLEELAISYKEATIAMRQKSSMVAHIKDIPDFLKCQDKYPEALEDISQICHNMLESKNNQSNSMVEQAKIYIEKNYYKGISLDDVSREVDISPYYFSKLFKEETGENFIYYLTNIRIEKAKELLKDQSLSVKEIGLRVGYNDPNYFSRIFKKNVGQTPTEYKERIF